MIQVRFRHGAEVVFGTLIGMFARMFIPLIACVAIAYRGGMWAEKRVYLLDAGRIPGLFGVPYALVSAPDGSNSRGSSGELRIDTHGVRTLQPA